AVVCPVRDVSPAEAGGGGPGGGGIPGCSGVAGDRPAERWRRGAGAMAAEQRGPPVARGSPGGRRDAGGAGTGVRRARRGGWLEGGNEGGTAGVGGDATPPCGPNTVEAALAPSPPGAYNTHLPQIRQRCPPHRQVVQ